MKKLIRKFRSNLSANVIGALVALMSFFGFLICLIGNICFTNAFEEEYASVTYHMAEGASVLVNGDHIDNYFNGEYMDEYEEMDKKLEVQCKKLNVSLIYVIKFIDTENYSRYKNVVNVVNNDVDNTSYTPWELGYERNASDVEYQKKYKAIFDKEVAYETYFRHHPSNNQKPHITTMIPIKNSSDNVVAIMCMQRPISEMSSAMAPYLISIIAGVVVMGAVMCAAATYYLKHAVIKPIETVSIEANRFATDARTQNKLGEISRYEVLQSLANSIDQMEEDTINYIGSLSKMTSEREKAKAELNIAAKIQQDMLPNLNEAKYDNEMFDVAAAMDPAREVGGDFYNFAQIDNDHIAMYIADVSGKGIPAALMMMGANIVLSNRSKLGGSPSEILEFANKAVCRHNGAGMFVTVWLGIYEISTHKLISANAGHEDPFIYDGKDFKLNKEKHGVVLGAFEDAKYVNQETTLHAGSKIFVYTDGIPEATNTDNEMFGLTRTEETLNKNKDKSVNEILNQIAKSVVEFEGEAPQFDDFTMICLEVKK